MPQETLPTHDFGAISAGEQSAFTVSGNLSLVFPMRARITSALIRNSSGFDVTLPDLGDQRIETGERKRVEFPGGTWALRVEAPDGAVSAGEVTAEIEVEW